ncbi:hypothetical protein CEXT_482071 [Caerostris extrusa]|uniref:Uncharacterized protein n=1 Tax=Caerostris extrusa TaxID=172846 RepID=A0AAV4YB63_CAEEX|nr:hypothetical protein CEXT_482071 [Caerostris extrusa]
MLPRVMKPIIECLSAGISNELCDLRKRTAGATVPVPPVGYLPCLMGDGRLRPMMAILLCQMACYGGIIRCEGKSVNHLRGPPNR